MSGPVARTRVALDSSVLQAEDPVGFRDMLKAIRDWSGLTPGQIAAKTGMPRSTAYSLVSDKRTTLPVNPEHVRAFVTACGLDTVATDNILTIHQNLATLADNEQDTKAPDIDGVPAPEATTRIAESVLKRSLCDSPEAINLAVLLNESTSLRWPPLVRHSSWRETLTYIINNQERTDRALRLLWVALALGTVLLTAAIILVVIYRPSGQIVGYTAAGIAVLALSTPLVARLRRHRVRRELNERWKTYGTLLEE